MRKPLSAKQSYEEPNLTLSAKTHLLKKLVKNHIKY